jgi:uncharacterized membrane protein YebE (DUF533 family)
VRSAIAIGAGAALGGVLIADRVAGVDDTIVLAGIGYLAYVVSYQTAKRANARRQPAVAAAKRAKPDDDVDVFTAFLDALHDPSR